MPPNACVLSVRSKVDLVPLSSSNRRGSNTAKWLLPSVWETCSIYDRGSLEEQCNIMWCRSNTLGYDHAIDTVCGYSAQQMDQPA